MSVSGFLQSPHPNGRKMAQRHPLRAQALAQSGWRATLVSGGGAVIPATSRQHLFRTPSLGGQARGFSTCLSALFLWFVDPARGSAHSSQRPGFMLHPARPVSCKIGLENPLIEGSAECSFRNYGLRLRLWAAWPHVATQWANRPLSAARLARARQRSLTAMWRPVRPWASRATCSSAKQTRTAANHAFASATHLTHFQTSRTAREASLARGFLRGTFLKTKDVPCSTRS